MKFFQHRFGELKKKAVQQLSEQGLIEQRKLNTNNMIFKQQQQQHSLSMILFSSTGFEDAQISTKCYLNMRYQGTDTAMMISLDDGWYF